MMEVTCEMGMNRVLVSSGFWSITTQAEFSEEVDQVQRADLTIVVAIVKESTGVLSAEGAAAVVHGGL